MRTFGEREGGGVGRWRTDTFVTLICTRLAGVDQVLLLQQQQQEPSTPPSASISLCCVFFAYRSTQSPVPPLVSVCPGRVRGGPLERALEWANGAPVPAPTTLLLVKGSGLGTLEFQLNHWLQEDCRLNSLSLCCSCCCWAREKTGQAPPFLFWLGGQGCT